jgi:PIN domain nuclease of toxin-antitoxin system
MLAPDLTVAALAGEISSQFAKPPYALSMADCVCLAQAKILNLPVITADKS